MTTLVKLCSSQDAQPKNAPHPAFRSLVSECAEPVTAAVLQLVVRVFLVALVRVLHVQPMQWLGVVLLVNGLLLVFSVVFTGQSPPHAA